MTKNMDAIIRRSRAEVYAKKDLATQLY